MAEYVKKDEAIAIIEERQKMCCPVGRYGRGYAENRDEFDAWQTIIDEINALPTLEVDKTALRYHVQLSAPTAEELELRDKFFQQLHEELSCKMDGADLVEEIPDIDLEE